jgi:hypothetical protein
MKRKRSRLGERMTDDLTTSLRNLFRVRKIGALVQLKQSIKADGGRRIFSSGSYHVSHGDSFRDEALAACSKFADDLILHGHRALEGLPKRSAKELPGALRNEFEDFQRDYIACLSRKVQLNLEPIRQKLESYQMPRASGPESKQKQEGDVIRFQGNGLVVYKGEPYPISPTQEEVLKKCMDAWEKAGRKKITIVSRNVCQLDHSIGRDFKGHPLLKKFRIFTSRTRPKGAFFFNP